MRRPTSRRGRADPASLVVAYRRLRDRGGRLTVVADHEDVVRKFAMTGLDRLFEVCNDFDVEE